MVGLGSVRWPSPPERDPCSICLTGQSSESLEGVRATDGQKNSKEDHTKRKLTLSFRKRYDEKQEPEQTDGCLEIVQIKHPVITLSNDLEPNNVVEIYIIFVVFC